MKFKTEFEIAWVLIGLIGGLAWAIGRDDFGIEENSKPAPSPTAPKIVLSSPLPLKSPVVDLGDEAPAGFGA
jgi:hypothetical protein